jgi:hypothetical protein
METFDHILFDENLTRINGEDWEFTTQSYRSEVEFVGWTVNDIVFKTICEYCSKRLLKKEESIESAYLAVSVCDNCGFWQGYYDQLEYGPNQVFISKIREFERVMPDVCFSDLARMIRRQQGIWHTISPRKLEELVAHVFRANYSQSEVFHVGKPDDGGVDVIFIDSQETQWLIQVKRREGPDKAEGVSTVRNLLGAMLLNDKLNGIVVSTADHFTYRAYQAVHRASEIGMHLRLIDRGKLDRMLKPLIQDGTWQKMLEPFVGKELIDFLQDKRRNHNLRKEFWDALSH